MGEEEKGEDKDSGPWPCEAIAEARWVGCRVGRRGKDGKGLIHNSKQCTCYLGKEIPSGGPSVLQKAP